MWSGIYVVGWSALGVDSMTRGKDPGSRPGGGGNPWPGGGGGKPPDSMRRASDLDRGLGMGSAEQAEIAQRTGSRGEVGPGPGGPGGPPIEGGGGPPTKPGGAPAIPGACTMKKRFEVDGAAVREGGRSSS